MDSSSGPNAATPHDRLEPEKEQSAEREVLDSKDVPQIESTKWPSPVESKSADQSSNCRHGLSRRIQGLVGQSGRILMKLAKFIGPGFMVYVNSISVVHITDADR